MANFTFIDLFAGIGGFRLALESVGGHCIGFSEIAPDAIRTYCDNFHEPTYCNFGDITKLDRLPKHDLMTAGVPCQSWSIAGKNLGFDDDRGQLWNDTLFLLNKVRPKAFIFENVKGLSDPRNRQALDYIMQRISEAGYHAKKFVLNAYDYGVPQTRVRIYIVGFKEKQYLEKLVLPAPCPGSIQLSDVLDETLHEVSHRQFLNKTRWSLSCNDQGFNDYFLFNDLRNGATTIHSWDIQETTERQKSICYLLLRNRRKSEYGHLDGNPLSLDNFQALDSTIKEEELEQLVIMQILKRVAYLYEIVDEGSATTEAEYQILSLREGNMLNYDKLKVNREIKKRGYNVAESLQAMENKGMVRCVEIRYDFKNTKISTGLAGVNRIFLPTSKIYPTLVASDTNDFVTPLKIEASNIEDFRIAFLEKVYEAGNYRKITKSEACRIQGFPEDFRLPPTRQRWMKLIGNSVAVPVIKTLAKAIVDTGIFAGNPFLTKEDKTIIRSNMQNQSLFRTYQKQGTQTVLF
ncbi:MAG: DNA (cytosine-5-)-methyltransferase [Bacteroidales bacterium]|nr:DNA (cytosine-5-)-methyltransferase [Bacteroidales bacterium]